MTVAAASGHAQTWLDYGTISMTDAVTPRLTERYVCYTDGANLACNAAARRSCDVGSDGRGRYKTRNDS